MQEATQPLDELDELLLDDDELLELDDDELLLLELDDDELLELDDELLELDDEDEGQEGGGIVCKTPPMVQEPQHKTPSIILQHSRLEPAHCLLSEGSSQVGIDPLQQSLFSESSQYALSGLLVQNPEEEELLLDDEDELLLDDDELLEEELELDELLLLDDDELLELEEEEEV